MTATRKSGSKSKRIDDVAHLLSRVSDTNVSPHQANDLIDEISQLLWAVSSLDPESEHLLKHSGYVANLATQVQG
jgi:hypothetical protein